MLYSIVNQINIGATLKLICMTFQCNYKNLIMLSFLISLLICFFLDPVCNEKTEPPTTTRITENTTEQGPATQAARKSASSGRLSE